MQATKEGIQVTKIVAPAAMEGEDPHGGGATHESHYFDVHKLRGGGVTHEPHYFDVHMLRRAAWGTTSTGVHRWQ